MAYADFSKAARLKLQMERTQNVGFGRSQARKVTARSEAHHKRWLKSIGAEDTKLYTLDKYYEGKYNNSPAYKVLMDYKDLVKHGEISPLLGLRAYSNYVKAIENNLIGIKTPLGFEVEGFTPHFVGRAIGRAGLSKKYNRDSVSVEDLLACLKSGRIGKTQISSKGEKSVLLISDKCFISMNPDKKILVQCNP